MADPTTVNIALAVPLHGSNVDTWDVPLNADFTAIDGFFGGVQTVSVSNTPVTLTSPTGTVTPSAGPSQSQNSVLVFTGTLTANVQVTLPLPGPIIVTNLTTGAFVLNFRAAGVGEIIAVDQGISQRIYNDGTNVRFVDLPPIGSYLDIAQSTVPAWITTCTKPPFLLCNGGTFSAVTYPYLNTKLGGNTLPDLRGVSRYTLNQGTSRLTTAGSGLDGDTLFSIKSTQSRTLLTANLPPYTPSGTVSTNVSASGFAINVVLGGTSGVGVGGGGAFGISGNASLSITANATSSFTGIAQGGTSTPIGLIGTGVVAGITLIRAG